MKAPTPKRAKPEPVQQVKQRRDAALQSLVKGVPYIQHMGFKFDRRGDEITGIMPYKDMLIGNPMLPALHGGATAAFLETTAIIELSRAMLWDRMEAGEVLPEAGKKDVGGLRLPKTIDFTVDYLRSGLPRDAYARAAINRAGRRYASVRVDAWQDNRSRLFAQATGHFLMPQTDR